jgi:hypothetical protein
VAVGATQPVDTGWQDVTAPAAPSPSAASGAPAESGWKDVTGDPQKHAQASGLLDAVERFGQGYYEKTIKPLVDTATTAAQAVAHPVDTAQAIANSPIVQHPIDTAVKALKDSYDRHAQLLNGARTSLDKGTPEGIDDAIERGTNAMIPILGPQVQSSLDKVKSGDVAGGTGELGGLLTQVATLFPGAPEKALGLLSDAADAAKTAGGVLAAGAKAGGADIAAGAAKAGTGVALPFALAHVPGGPAVQTGLELAGVPKAWKLGKSGVAQIRTGVQNASDAMTAKIAQAGEANRAIKRLEDAFDPATAPKSDVQLSSPVSPVPAAAPWDKSQAPVAAPPADAPQSAGAMQPSTGKPAIPPVTLPYKQALNPATGKNLVEGDRMVRPGGQELVLQRVPIDQIEPDPGNEVYQPKVTEYKTGGWYQAPVLQPGEDAPYRVWNGHHRITAAHQAGQNDILAWTPAPPQAATDLTTIPFSRENPPSEAFAEDARAAKAPAEQKFAEKMQQGGLSSDDVANMDDKHWGQLAAQLVMDKPTVGARARIAFNLKQLESKRPDISPQLLERLKSTGSLPIAQQLRDQMGQ